MVKAGKKVARTSGRSVAIVDSGMGVLSIGGLKYRAVEQVIVPTLRQRGDDAAPVAIKITGPMYEAEKIDAREVKETKGKEKEQMSPPWVVPVINLQDGGAYTYVLNAITRRALEDYAKRKDDKSGVPAYVGKSFMIKKGGIAGGAPGRQYRAINMFEMHTDGEVADEKDGKAA